MKLHLRHRQRGNNLRRLRHIQPVIPGKISNHMGAEIEAIPPDAEGRIDKLRQPVAAVQHRKGVHITALEPQLHRHILPIPQRRLLQHIQVRLMNAVRPGRHIHRHHRRMTHGLLHPAFEIRQRGIGIRKIQEISNKLPRLVLRPHMSHTPVQLAGNTHAHRLRLIISADGPAENTAPRRKTPVPVRTGHRKRHRDLVHLLPVPLLQIIRIIPVTLHTSPVLQ